MDEGRRVFGRIEIHSLPAPFLSSVAYLDRDFFGGQNAPDWHGKTDRDCRSNDAIEVAA